mmetsp:Transcript_20071/g.23989  ORF Transcript_20071/g.23989 Transcript_20071/m.23989 type:complete len:100 (-) Transcript_20071:390-689(-)
MSTEMLASFPSLQQRPSLQDMNAESRMSNTDICSLVSVPFVFWGGSKSVDDVSVTMLDVVVVSIFPKSTAEPIDHKRLSFYVKWAYSVLMADLTGAYNL